MNIDNIMKIFKILGIMGFYFDINVSIKSMMLLVKDVVIGNMKDV